MRPDRRPPIEELTGETGSAPVPGYEEWKRAKIERALEELKEPDKLIPAEQVWRDLGLET